MACVPKAPVLATDLVVLKSFELLRREGSREYCEESVATCTIPGCKGSGYSVGGGPRAHLYQ